MGPTTQPPLSGNLQSRLRRFDSGRRLRLEQAVLASFGPAIAEAAGIKWASI